MKKYYTEPLMEIKEFAYENIVTLSALNSNTYNEALEGLTTGTEQIDPANVFSFTV